MKFKWFFVCVILLSFISVGKSLRFSLGGDDWLALFRYQTTFSSFISHFQLSNYTGNYDAANILMGLIYRIFEYNPFPYYLVSMILRTIAAISFYPAIHAVTKDKLAAVFSSVFFSTVFAGIETTNWVFNMNTYVSITLFNSFIYFYYSQDFGVLSKRNFLTSLILGLSFIFTQNRMHGFLFVIPLFVFAKVHKFNKENLKEAVLRLGIFFLPIFTYRFLTRSSNDIAYAGFFIQAISQWKSLILSIFSSIGNALLPDKIYIFLNITETPKAFLILIALLILIPLILKMGLHSRKYFFLFICLSIPIFFLIIPLILYGPAGTLSSDHRYLIIPGAYILASFAIFLSELLKSKKQMYKNLSVILITLIISINFISLLRYFDKLSKSGRLAEDAEKQFNFIKSQINKPNPGSPVAFLFVPDDPTYLYNAITFGFTYHLMLIDKRFTLDFQKSAFPADNIESLIDVLSGPQSKELLRYGYKPVQIPLENVFVFKLQNKNLTNITSEAKDFLKTKLPSLE